jgi:hypothetical protein
VELHHHVPMMFHQQPLDQTTLPPTTLPDQEAESDKTEEEDMEFQDEEPQALLAAKKAAKLEAIEIHSTEDTLNAETDEEIFEAENRLKGRRGEEKTRERHVARSLYPFILNRLLG